MAELEPVELDGTVVSRASLHNESWINSLGILPSDTVRIRKAGAIIPEVIEKVADGPARANAPGAKVCPDVASSSCLATGLALEGAPLEFHLGASIEWRCPSCGQTSVVGSTAKPGGPVRWSCANTASCPAQMAERIRYMAGRDCLDLEQLGGEVCNAIAQMGLFTHPLEILHVERAALVDSLSRLAWTTDTGGRMTFGASRAATVADAVARAWDLPLDRWIAALGIPTIGRNTSKEIARLVGTRDVLKIACADQVDGLFARMVESLSLDEVLYEELKQQYAVSPRLGPVSLRHLVEFVTSADGWKVMDLIPASVKADNYDPIPAPKTGRLAGKVVVITGTLSQPRDHFVDLITRHDGKVAGSVTKNTSFVLAGEKAGSKLDKAKALNVEVIDEATFNQRIA